MEMPSKPSFSPVKLERQCSLDSEDDSSLTRSWVNVQRPQLVTNCPWNVAPIQIWVHIDLDDTRHLATCHNIIDFLEANYKFQCYYHQQDLGMEGYILDFEVDMMKKNSFYVMCATANSLVREEHVYREAVENFKKKNGRKVFVIVNLDGCELPVYLTHHTRVISLVEGEDRHRQLQQLEFILLGIENDVRLPHVNLLDARYIGFHPHPQAGSYYDNCRYIDCDPSKILFQQLPHTYSKNLLIVEFRQAKPGVPYFISQVKSTKDVFDMISRTNAALIRCKDNMVCATYISIQTLSFGDENHPLDFNVSNRSNNMINVTVNQAFLLYSKSYSPLGEDWCDVTKISNVKIEPSSGYYTFDAKKMGIYLLCARKSDETPLDQFSPSIVACQISKTVNKQFRRIGLHWDWDETKPLHDRQLTVNIYNMDLTHPETLDYLINFNSSSRIIAPEASITLYAKVFYISEGVTLSSIPLELNICTTLEEFKMAFPSTLRWKLVVELYNDADRNRHITTIKISKQRVITFVPKPEAFDPMAMLLETDDHDRAIGAAPLERTKNWVSLEAGPDLRPNHYMYIEEVSTILSSLWSCISGEALPDNFTEVTDTMHHALRRRAISLVESAQAVNMFNVYENLAKVSRNVGDTRKFNRQSKLLLQAVHNVLEHRQDKTQGDIGRQAKSLPPTPTGKKTRLKDCTKPRHFVPRAGSCSMQ